MPMRITWMIAGRGAGQADVDSVEEAARAVARALDADAHTMLTVIAPLRHALVTDGRYAVERGAPWHYTAGAIHVTLSPWDDTK